MKVGIPAKTLFGLVAIQIALVLAGITALWFLLPLHPNAPRIGYVDTARMLEGFGEAKRNRANIDSLNMDWQGKAKSLKDSLDAYMANMGASYEKAPQAERQKMRVELERRNQELGQYAKASQEKVMAKEQEMLAPTLAKINALLDDYAKARGYDLILGSTSTGNILAGAARYDLTDEVIEELNKKYK